MLLFKIKDDYFRSYIFKIEDGSSMLSSNWKDLGGFTLNNIPENFNGSYNFYDFGGRFVGSWSIIDGRRERSISFKEKIKVEDSEDNKGKRLENYTYSCVVTTHSTYVQAGSGDPYVVEQYEVWDCIFTPMFAGPETGMPSGGGEDPGCYEPHPDFEGYMVPCGSLENCTCCKVPESERVLCEQQSPPCEDYPLYQIEIQKTAAWTSKNSGRYSATARKNLDKTPKAHWGLDIAAPVNTPVFSVYPGVVVDIEKDISPNKYIYGSFGNFVK